MEDKKDKIKLLYNKHMGKYVVVHLQNGVSVFGKLSDINVSPNDYSAVLEEVLSIRQGERSPLVKQTKETINLQLILGISEISKEDYEFSKNNILPPSVGYLDTWVGIKIGNGEYVGKLHKILRDYSIQLLPSLCTKMGKDYVEPYIEEKTPITITQRDMVIKPTSREDVEKAIEKELEELNKKLKKSKKSKRK